LEGPQIYLTVPKKQTGRVLNNPQWNAVGFEVPIKVLREKNS